MKYSLLNQAIERGAKTGGIHIGVAVVSIAPEIRGMVRNKIMPLYCKLEGTEYFSEIVRFLEEIDCSPVIENDRDPHEDCLIPA